MLTGTVSSKVFDRFTEFECQRLTQRCWVLKCVVRCLTWAWPREHLNSISYHLGRRKQHMPKTSTMQIRGSFLSSQARRHLLKSSISLRRRFIQLTTWVSCSGDSDASFLYQLPCFIQYVVALTLIFNIVKPQMILISGTKGWTEREKCPTRFVKDRGKVTIWLSSLFTVGSVSGSSITWRMSLWTLCPSKGKHTFFLSKNP